MELKLRIHEGPFLKTDNIVTVRIQRFGTDGSGQTV